MSGFKIIIGILSTTLFLYLAVRDVEFGRLSTALRITDYTFFAFAMTMAIVVWWVRAWRWRVILCPLRTVRIHKLFAATMIGLLANNALPFRAGELAKALVLKNSEKVGLSGGLATIVLERIFDGITVSLLSVTLLFVPAISGWVRQVAVGVSIVFLGTLVSLTLLVVYKRQLLAIAVIRRLFSGRLGQKLEGFLRDFAQGLGILQNAISVAKITALSILIWIGLAVISHLVLLSLGIRTPLVVTLVVLLFTAMGTMLPAAPGNLGTFQYFAVMALTAFALPKDLALAYACLLHASLWLPATLGGLACAWLFGLGGQGLKPGMASFRISTGRLP